jgi:dihydroneopterin aldolase
MDKLTLKNIRLSGKHGVFEKEKISGNTFEVDVEFYGDFSAAAHSDQLDDTIDYSLVAQVVEQVISGESVDLIEHLAHQLIEALKSQFEQAQRIKLRLRKLQPPMQPGADWAEIELSWPN